MQGFSKSHVSWPTDDAVTIASALILSGMESDTFAKPQDEC